MGTAGSEWMYLVQAMDPRSSLQVMCCAGAHVWRLRWPLFGRRGFEVRGAYKVQRGHIEAIFTSESASQIARTKRRTKVQAAKPLTPTQCLIRGHA